MSKKHIGNPKVDKAALDLLTKLGEASKQAKEFLKSTHKDEGAQNLDAGALGDAESLIWEAISNCCKSMAVVRKYQTVRYEQSPSRGHKKNHKSADAGSDTGSVADSNGTVQTVS